MNNKNIIRILIICFITTAAVASFRLLVRAQGPSQAKNTAEPAKKEAGPSAGASTPGPLSVTRDPSPEAAVPAPPPAEKYDFSDGSHWNLTVSAWEKLAEKDFEGVFAYANKCIELYAAEAKEAAAKMKSFARPGREDDHSVVNDVATSHYIMGEAYMKQGRPQEALKEFEYVIANYPYAQCWDPKGWFWKVAEVSKKNIDKLAGPREGSAK